MSVLVLVVLTVSFLTVMVSASLLFFWKYKSKEYQTEISDLPSVSILVSARDEEENIARCIKSLVKLEYPNEKLKILIGDDESSDNTLAIAQDFSAENSQVKTFTFQGCKSKADVLAKLADRAEGEIYLFTDADVVVSTSWVRGMLSAYDAKVGIVNGVTSIEGENMWSKLQDIEWLTAIGMVKVATDSNYPVTAIGNNMLVSRKAYEATGGFEAISFSFVEDYHLAKLINEGGFEIRHCLNKNVLAHTQGEGSWLELFRQRKRWMEGAMQVPWGFRLALILQTAYYPAVILLFLTRPTLGLFVFLLKTLVQFSFVRLIFKKLNKRLSLIDAIFYEPYAGITSLGSLLFYLLPIKTTWKGRQHVDKS